MGQVLDFKRAGDNEIMAYITTTKSLKDTSEMLGVPITRVNELFFRSDVWVKLKGRLSFIVSSYGKGNHKEDVISEYAVKILSDKNVHQSLDQFFIDYARKHRWTRRDGKLATVVYTSQLDYAKDAKSSNNPLCNSMLSNASSQFRDKKYLAFLSLKSRWGMSADEIAEIFSVSPVTVHKAFRDGYCFEAMEKLGKENKILNSSEKISVLEAKVASLEGKIDEITSSNRLVDISKVKDLKKLERHLVETALLNHSQEVAAKMLGISPRTIRNRLKKYKQMDSKL